jgi:hypothetical protein
MNVRFHNISVNDSSEVHRHRAIVSFQCIFWDVSSLWRTDTGLPRACAFEYTKFRQTNQLVGVQTLKKRHKGTQK